MIEAIATGGEFVRQRIDGPVGDRHRNPAEILWLGENTGLGGDRVFAQNGAADDGGKNGGC